MSSVGASSVIDSLSVSTCSGSGDEDGLGKYLSSLVVMGGAEGDRAG